MSRTRGILVAISVAVVATVPTVPGGPAGAGWTAQAPGTAIRTPSAVAHAASGTPSRSVTLITGDQVRVTGVAGSAVTVRPASGRDRITFLTHRVSDRTYVLPADAAPLVAEGRLDQRLFDVTTLLEFGYDDARRSDIPLIVQYAKTAQRATVRSRVAAAGSSIRADLPAGRSLAVREDKRTAGGFWASATAATGPTPRLATGIDRIWLDGKRRVHLDETVPLVGAPAAWAAGITGAGVTVAMLDTGVDSNHPDLAGKIFAERDFTAAPMAGDRVGHGTHVASVIAGSGAASDGRYRGVAPDVRLASGRVCETEECSESATLAGLHWAAAELRAKVVNVAIGGPDTPGLDPLEEAINTLTAQYGTLFVVSAGNKGPGRETVTSPGSADAALTVGATTKTDVLWGNSGRGPRSGDAAIKPDIVAPGTYVVAAASQDAWCPEPVGAAYCGRYGTSAAAPHVTGAAALLASQHPDWGPGRLKAALMDAAHPLTNTEPYSIGAGRLDVAKAVDLRVVAEPGSLSLGIQLWPHRDDEPIAKTVTYTNTDAAPVSVDLAAHLAGPYDEPVPAGIFALSTSRITVPAGGTGSATLTANTRGTPTPGSYTGHLVATVDGKVIARTPIALEVEPERYGVTIRHIDANGAPPSLHYSVLTRTDLQDRRILRSPSGTLTLRLPKATYVITSLIVTNPETAQQLDSLITYPLLKVDRDRTVNLDARRARPVQLTVPDRHPTDGVVTVGFDYRLPIGGAGWHASRAMGQITILRLGPNPPKSDLVGRIEAMVSRTDTPTPYLYNLAWYLPGSFPTGFTRTVRRSELATVNEAYLVPRAGMFGIRETYAVPTKNAWIGSSGLLVSREFPLPATGTVHYLTRDVSWVDALTEFTPGYNLYERQETASPVRFQPGHAYQVRWNGAVVGPSGVGNPVQRDQNYLLVNIPMFSDGVPGHVGTASYDAARTTLYRDGRFVAESDLAGFIQADVSMDVSDFRLFADVTRSADVSTRITGTWFFRSGVAGEGAATVPIMTVRFSPPVDDTNTAPAGRVISVPVRVDGAVDGVTALAVEVSYDEGATWRRVTVSRSGKLWLARMAHPAEAGHAAVRARATDGQGNTVEETIIRAYHIG